jgi:glycosyltransferase involved in cell wall biosynthesis
LTPTDDFRRPRLLILATLAEAGGVVTHLTLLLPALVDTFDVAVAAYGPGPLRAATLDAGARFVSLRHVRRPIAPLRDLVGLIELIRLCRRERPDIVYANSAKAGVLGRLAGALTGVPVRIYGAHGWAFATHPGRRASLYLLAERLMRPFTSLTVCVSESERARGLAARTCVRERTVVIRNGIDPDTVAQARHDSGTPRIVSVGRFKAPKDFITLIRALSGLPTCSFSAQIIGSGPDHEDIEEEIRSMELTNGVELLGERDDVLELLARADIFALSTTSEGLPMTVLEAMAAGLPVVASAVGGVPELVVHEQTGLLVPAGDSEALGAALGRLVAEPHLRRRLGAAGRARVRACFDLASFRRKHLIVYRRELAARGLRLRGLDVSLRAE